MARISLSDRVDSPGIFLVSTETEELFWIRLGRLLRGPGNNRSAGLGVHSAS